MKIKKKTISIYDMIKAVNLTKNTFDFTFNPKQT